MSAFALDTLSYSGRLVQASGAPVTGTVKIRAELAYTNNTSSVLCSDEISNVTLSKGVFHVKIDFDCSVSGKTLTQVLSQTPAGHSVAIQITDITDVDPTKHKAYSFQALHSMPFATVASQLVQMGAGDGQFLKWNNTNKEWEPGSVTGATGGTVTNVTANSPISVSNGTSTPDISISQADSTTSGYLSSADWNAFNSKQGSITAGTAAQYYRGDKTWQTLNSDAVPEGSTNLYFQNARVLGLPLTGFSPTSSAIVATDSVVQGFSKAQGQINTINSASGNYLVKNSTDIISGTVNVGVSGFLTITNAPSILTDVTNKQYVDTRDALKVNKAGDTITGVLTLDDDLKIKGGSSYVTVKGHASSAAYDLVLPQTAGTSGYVLRTDGAGNLSWIDPSSVAAGTGTVGTGSITDGSIVDADINTSAAIAQSKIANLTTDLAAKVSTTLNSGNILVGSGTNVATAVAVSGDATLSNTGALTLANSGATAGTYKSVTVDAKGRVTGGTNPTTLSGYGITDTLVKSVTGTAPVTVTGTATDPVIAMPVATTSEDGYLSTTDWNTFNNKQATISKTTVQDVSKLRIYGANTTNYVELSAAILTGNRSLIFPDSNGSNGNFLTTDGAGNLSWTSPSTSTINLAGDIGGTTGSNTIGAGKVTLTHLSATGTPSASTYLRGNNTWSSLSADVQALALSAYTLGTNAVLNTSDTVTSAFGKLQKQISDLTTSAVGGDLTGTLPNPTIAKLQGNTVTTSSVANKNVLKYNGSAWVNSMIAAGDLSATGTPNASTYLAGDNSWKDFRTEVRATPLAGLSSSGINYGNSPLVAADSITDAFNKLLFTQGDYVSKSANQTINGTLKINSLTGFITVPDPLTGKDAANKDYVDGFGQWTKGTGANAADIYRLSGNVGIGTSAPGYGLTVVNGNTANSGAMFVAASLNNSGKGLVIDSTTRTATENSVLALEMINRAGTNTLAATVGGSIGIGTSTPVNRLSFSADGTTKSIYDSNEQFQFHGNTQIYGTISSDNQTFAMGVNGAASSTNAGEGGWVGTLSNDRFHVRTNNAERMVITSGGNVGFGISNPIAKLSVVSPILQGLTATYLNSLDLGFSSDIGAAGPPQFLLLFPYYNGVNSSPAGFSGTVRCLRGNGAAGNYAYAYNILAQTAYNQTIASIDPQGFSPYANLYRVTYSGTPYLALRLSEISGSGCEFSMEGQYWNTINSQNPTIVLESATTLNSTVYDYLTIGKDVYNKAGNIGIGTTNPTAKLDVRGGQATVEQFPVKVFMGMASQSSALSVTGPTWTDIPGTTINVTLPRAMTLLMEGNGSVSVTAGATTKSTHCGFRFVINGTPEGSANWGDVIAGVNSSVDTVNHGWWTPWTMKRTKSLAAGAYTIKIQMIGWMSNDSTCYTDGNEYSRAILSLEGW